ncbi:MAG: chemotaxis protein CheW [Inhella sp.]|jgi:twitching motility protein PilI|uniref:chemotaxis protein CheW n=1 Tax=Inhella sp. TaxID=1921806 RepID=UPI0022CA624F|nr:CheW domain-containing protein [Inhella sp.]MCZ8236671.1 CheW domain-containing protein [Inhella sp.]
MGNKVALREFQQRLAERLAAAKVQSQASRWLAVDCGGLGLLLPLQQAGEIFAPMPMTTVPYTQPWMLGVANLRGGLHAVVDLSVFLGLRQRPRSDGGGRLVSMSGDLHINCALLVDRLLGLRSDDQLRRVTEPSDAPRPHFASEQREDEQGRRWQVLDLELLARFEPFLNIVAAA